MVPRWAIKLVARCRATGSASPAKRGGHKLRTLRSERTEWLIACCGEMDFTISQLAEELRAERGLTADRSSV